MDGAPTQGWGGPREARKTILESRERYLAARAASA
jgi:hypothetical protein